MQTVTQETALPVPGAAFESFGATASNAHSKGCALGTENFPAKRETGCYQKRRHAEGGTIGR